MKMPHTKCLGTSTASGAAVLAACGSTSRAGGTCLLRPQAPTTHTTFTEQSINDKLVDLTAGLGGGHHAAVAPWDYIEDIRISETCVSDDALLHRPSSLQHVQCSLLQARAAPHATA